MIFTICVIVSQILFGKWFLNELHWEFDPSMMIEKREMKRKRRKKIYELFKN